jgi:hypothetical protein
MRPTGAFESAALHRLGEIFDEVWSSLAPDIGKSGEETERARNRLALIVIELGKDGQLGDLQITRTAARLMRERALQTPPWGGRT